MEINNNTEATFEKEKSLINKTSFLHLILHQLRNKTKDSTENPIIRVSA